MTSSALPQLSTPMVLIVFTMPERRSIYTICAYRSNFKVDTWYACEQTTSCLLLSITSNHYYVSLGWVKWHNLHGLSVRGSMLSLKTPGWHVLTKHKVILTLGNGSTRKVTACCCVRGIRSDVSLIFLDRGCMYNSWEVHFLIGFMCAAVTIVKCFSSVDIVIKEDGEPISNWINFVS